MELNTLYFSANTSAVDVYLITKDKIIPEFAKRQGCSLEQIAAIGDGDNDLPMLSFPGLGLVGAPANATDKVKKVISDLNGYLASQEAFEGFFEFYHLVKQRGITHILSDRDGVLLEKGDYSRGPEFKALAQGMGFGMNPFVAILTGTSMDQNIYFMEAYGLDASLASNPKVREYPFLVLAENGAVHINVLTGDALEFFDLSGHPLMKALQGDLRREVMNRLGKEILPGMKLGFSLDTNDQTQKVYLPPKKTMITFNVPRNYEDGRDYRKSEDAKRLRSEIIRVLSETATKMNLPYCVI